MKKNDTNNSLQQKSIKICFQQNHKSNVTFPDLSINQAYLLTDLTAAM